ncbi:MAG TPA: BatD family protein [Bacteriovoracaceae bacterium]|nr:BatD family protein [Bacteriovoracaceae bacterium]
MKLIMALIAIFSINLVSADEIKVEITPPKPVVKEVFQATFRVFTDADGEPEITFNPANIEVVGKANQGISTRTVYANGKLTVTREMTVSYDMVAAKVGTSFLRDIKVVVDGKTIRHPAIAINILTEPEEVPELFVMADVPKKTLYVGEGITARYYLYSKVPINTVDIKKYPKLNGFLKRFLQEPDRSERVSVDGQLYLRTQIYAAKLFPEKAGELKIDSMGLSASYPSTRSNDPFGAFGLNRNFRNKTIESEAVKINVLPLPEPVPANFSGLVSRHDIQVQFGQTKLIINEPLEVKLIVSGGGALENLEAPAFLKHQALEEFESNGDLKIANAEEATKTFDYTFLAREAVKLPASTLVLSYFDPNQSTYVPVNLQIPEIEIAGGGQATSSRPPEKKAGNENRDTPKPGPSAPVKTEDFAGPLLQAGKDYKTWLPYMNASLAVLSILLAIGWVIRKEGPVFNRSKSEIPAQFRKGQFSLGEFTKWLSPLIQKSGKSPYAIIKESDLDESTKTYFIDLLNSNDYKDYSSRTAQLDFTYNPGHFKKLGKYIESVKDENPSQPA